MENLLSGETIRKSLAIIIPYPIRALNFEQEKKGRPEGAAEAGQ